MGGGNWQPIETAPRDGTWVLIFCDGNAIQAQWDRDDAYWANGRFGLGFDDATHWMPLPEPPEA